MINTQNPMHLLPL